MNKETSLMHKIMLECSNGDTRLFRQNVGLAWAGHAEKFPGPRSVRVNAGDVVIRNARPFHAGVKGMPDLGGWTSITITPEMVGQRVAISTQVEVKTPTGAARDDQERFLNEAAKAGARVGIARDTETARAIIAGTYDPTSGSKRRSKAK